MAFNLSTTGAQGRVYRIPPRCRSAPAVRLCSIHTNHRRTEQLRVRMGLRWKRYRYVAEREPARRDWLVTYWTRRHRAALRAWRAYRSAPWLREPFYGEAMCIHRHESVDWHEPGSPGGGMQFMEGTWQAWGGTRYAAWPSEASPADQLHIAYLVVRHDGGWREWTTAPLCGL